MSLFSNQGATKPSGLFSGGTGTGTSTGSGGGLFANKTGTGTGTGTGSGGGLFSGSGTGTGTGSGGGLFSGSGTGSGLGGGLTGGGASGTFSLNAPNMNAQHEAEFNSVLERFALALEVQNVVTCQLKHPIYKTVQVDGNPTPETAQYKYLYNEALWEEYSKNNPGQIGKYQFYIGLVCGVDALEARVKNMTNLFDMLNKTVGEFRAKQDSISKEYEQKLRENISHVKRKNFLLLDKLLTVHALLEKVALQHNECERKPNEEMRIYNKYVTLEAVPNEIQTRLLDIRLNRENAKVVKPRGSLSNVTDTESKRNVLDLLAKMKKGVEILSKMNQEDSSDVEEMLKYTENRGKLY